MPSKTKTVPDDGIDLEERLAVRVPAYMTSIDYIAVEKIPIIVTGKTDHRRLREIDGLLTLEQLTILDPSRGERYPPNLEMDLQLQQLWVTVLGIGISSISADDSFLRVGDDSIQAT